MNFEINLVFLSKPVFLNDQTSRQKFKHRENEKSFQDEIKSIFHHFQRVLLKQTKFFMEGDSLT